MNVTQELHLKSQLEKLAKITLALLSDIEATEHFVSDNGGFGEGNPNVTTLTESEQTAYNGLMQLRNLLNGDSVVVAIHRRGLNQIMVSPQS